MMLIIGVLIVTRCAHEDSISSDVTRTYDATVQLLDVAETTGQLASGASFRISGSGSDTTADASGSGHGPHSPHPRSPGLLD